MWFPLILAAVLFLIALLMEAHKTQDIQSTLMMVFVAIILFCIGLFLGEDSAITSINIATEDIEAYLNGEIECAWNEVQERGVIIGSELECWEAE